jgi:hypothetical protein
MDMATEDNEISYTDYRDNSKELFKMIFGEEQYNILENTKMKSIDWDGLDISTTSITSVFPNIKERFGEKWIEYFEERNYSMLDLYIQAVFHFGYNQADIINKERIETYIQLTKIQQEVIKQLKSENDSK